MRIVLRSLAVILAFVTVFGSAQSQKKPSLTNQDIVRMVKDKFADSTIVKAIEANHTAFDVSATALIVLKDSGVSQTVRSNALGRDPQRRQCRNATRGNSRQASSSILAAVGTIGGLRAAAHNAIASTEYASLLRRPHFETRQTAGYASLS